MYVRTFKIIEKLYENADSATKINVRRTVVADSSTYMYIPFMAPHIDMNGPVYAYMRACSQIVRI